MGATFDELDSGFPSGQVTGTARFSCGCDGERSWAIRQMFGWKLLYQSSPGVWRVKKMNESQKAKHATNG